MTPQRRFRGQRPYNTNTHMERPVSVFLSSPGGRFSCTRSCPWNKNHMLPCLVERDSVLVSGLMSNTGFKGERLFEATSVGQHGKNWRDLTICHEKRKEYLQNLLSWHCTFPSLPADGDVVLQGSISATVDSEVTRTEGTWSCGSGTLVHLVKYAQRCERF